MKRIQKYILILVATAMTVLPEVSAAQTRQLTLEEAINLGLKHHTQILKARNLQRLTGMDVAGSYAEFLPSVSAGAGAGQNSGRQFIETEDRLVTQTTRGMSASVSAGMTLFNGFGRLHELREATLTDNAQQAAAKRTEEQVMSIILQDYVQILYDKEILRIREENLSALQDQLEQIREFVDLGLRSQTDLFQQQSAVADAGGLLIDARTTLSVDTAELLRKLSINPMEEYDVVSPDSAETAFGILPDSPDQYITRAMANRSDYREQELRVKAARQSLRAVQASLYPSLYLSYNYGSNANDVSERSFEAQFTRDNLYSSVGIRLSVPIFNQLGTRRFIASRQVELRNQEIDLEDLRQLILVDVKRAYLHYQAAVQKLEAANTRLRYASQALEAATERYNLGVTNFVEFSTANADYVEAAGNQAQARFALTLRRFNLEYATGTLEPEDFEDQKK
ncbi:MAG: hypothetical protein GF372_07790 [Candidatus Marinimicrobia bacterium]|nr:hypothetical protein [Candidatus Neomarinimicrobiota bacterium]